MLIPRALVDCTITILVEKCVSGADRESEHEVLMIGVVKTCVCLITQAILALSSFSRKMFQPFRTDG